MSEWEGVRALCDNDTSIEEGVNGLGAHCVPIVYQKRQNNVKMFNMFNNFEAILRPKCR